MKGFLPVFIMVLTLGVWANEPANRLLNPSFQNGAQHWSLYRGHIDSQTSRTAGSASLRFTYDKSKDKGQAIANQFVILNQTQARPILYGCSSKALNLPADAKPSHGLYGIELHVIFQDETERWISPKKTFTTGTHGWETIEELFIPPRPIKSVRFFCRLRNTGTVWYDDFILREAKQLENLKGCSASENARGDIILENDFLKLVLTPAKGGTCRSFIAKGQQAQFSGNQHPNYCMFTDRLRIKGNSFSRNYTATITKNTPEEAEVRLTLNAPDGYPFLKIDKTLRLTSHSSALKVTYDYTNQKASMAELVIEPYFRNGWGLKQIPTQHYRVPTAKGIQSFNTQGGNTYLDNLTAGWVASADGRGKAMVCEFDFSRTAMFYLWRGGPDKTTVEWCLAPVKIPPGETFTTAYDFFPAATMTAIENAENGIASELLTDRNSVRLNFQSAHAYLLTCQATVTRKDGTQKTYEKLLDLIPQDVATVTLEEDPQQLSMVRYGLSSRGQTVFAAVHPFFKGYEFPPRQPKAKPAEIKPFQIRLTDRVTSPHTQWAKPYAGGKPKVLFVTELVQLREIVELSQRLELDYRVIRTAQVEACCNWGMSDRYGAFSYADSNFSLKKELQKPLDAIVVSGMLWKHINQENRDTIARLMGQGLGLVMIAPENLPESIAKLANLPAPTTPETSRITAFQPLELIPHQRLSIPQALRQMTRLNPVLAVAETPKRRCAAFFWDASRNGLTPYLPYSMPEPDFRYQDYSLSLLARTILWVSRKSSTAYLENLELNENNLTLTIKADRPLRQTTAWVRLHNLPTQAQWEKTWKLDGKKNVTLTLPEQLPPGKTICDVILKQPEGTLDWATIQIERPLKGSITSIHTQQDFIRAGEEITGTIQHDAKATATMVLNLVDGYGRLLAHQSLTTDKTADFRLKVTEALTGRLFLKAKLFLDGKLVNMAQADILAEPTADPPSLPFAISESGYRWIARIRRYLNPIRFKALKDAGVNEMRFWTADGLLAYRDHLAYGFRFDFPVASHHLWHFNRDFAEPFAKTKDRKFLCRKPCLSDPDFLRNYQNGITEKMRSLSQFSPVSFDVGDENSLTRWGAPFDFCFSPHCLKAFRSWLKNSYGTLEQLNQEWQSTFKTWEEVVPMTTQEAQKKVAPTRHFAPWADHRRFMELTFCKAFQTVRDLSVKANLNIPIDMSGTQPPNSYSGMDFWLLSKAIQIPAAYDYDNIAEIIRSFRRPLMKPWYGYGQDGLPLEYRVWYDALRFQNSGFSYYNGSTLLYPDYTLSKQFMDLKHAIKDLQDGGAALLKTLYETPQVLIHYSQHSIHAATIEGRYPDFITARALWCKLLDDMHLPYRFVAYAEIEQGELLRNPARILILPLSTALSPREAQAIRDFASRGGLVVADRFPAIMNDHCTLQAKGLLDQVFGLNSPDLGGSRNTTVTLDGHVIPVATGPVTGPQPQLDGKAFFLHPYGQGAGLFLNLLWPQYLTLRTGTPDHRAGARAYRRKLQKLFSPYLPEQDVQVLETDTTCVKAFTFHQNSPDSAARFIGLVRECDVPAPKATLTLAWKSPAYLYNLRTKEALGQRNNVTLTLPAGKAALFAALPYKVNGLRLTLPPQARPGEDINLRLALQTQGAPNLAKHPLLLSVTNPAGEHLQYYDRIAYATDGGATITFRTALNDRPGTWMVKVTDYISGQTVTKTFRLLPP